MCSVVLDLSVDQEFPAEYVRADIFIHMCIVRKNESMREGLVGSSTYMITTRKCNGRETDQKGRHN